MTQIYDIISLDGFLYAVDKKVLPHKGDWYWASGLPVNEHSTFANSVHYADDENDSGLIQGTKDHPTGFHGFEAFYKPYKIISSSNPKLSSLPVLPEVGEDIESLFKSILKGKYHAAEIQKLLDHSLWAFKEGYKANKAKWTDEEVRDLIDNQQRVVRKAWGCSQDELMRAMYKEFKDNLQSLKPTPKQVECKVEQTPCMEERCLIHTCDGKCFKLKVDKYNKVVVRRYIYE